MSSRSSSIVQPFAGGADDEAAGARPIRARSLMKLRFRRWRSSSVPILRETPMCSTVGM